MNVLPIVTAVSSINRSQRIPSESGITQHNNLIFELSNYFLRSTKNPDARIVITEDINWISVLTEVGRIFYGLCSNSNDCFRRMTILCLLEIKFFGG